MRTVTFIPTKNKGFILTSNRDESAMRSPKDISQQVVGTQQLIFPKDKGAGGTWIAASSKNKFVCLLNGAFERHPRNTPYRKSRGIMVLEFFKCQDTNQFFAAYDLDNIESFTMIIYDNGQLWDFRWDEKQKFIKALNTNDFHIWSSATLYEKEVQSKREQWLDEWLVDRTDFSKEAILELHQKGGEGNPSTDFMMNRYNYLVQTVSITQIIGSQDRLEMHYHDLMNEQVNKANLSLKS
jgi:uncharacterized protein with NRDE domain